MVSDITKVSAAGTTVQHIWYYIGIGVLVQALIAFDALLASNSVPIPHAWAWATPVIASVAVFLTTALPKLVGE